MLDQVVGVVHGSSGDVGHIKQTRIQAYSDDYFCLSPFHDTIDCIRSTLPRLIRCAPTLSFTAALFGNGCRLQDIRNEDKIAPVKAADTDTQNKHETANTT